MLAGITKYPTFVVFIAIFIAAAIAIILMPWWIKLLKYRKIGQQIRADGPQRHLIKQGTPTMGGVIMLVAIVLTCVLCAPWSPSLALVLFATVATAALGFLDDFESVAHKRSLGLTPHAKLIGQALISVAFCLLAVNMLDVSPVVTLGPLNIDLGALAFTLPLGEGIYVPWLYVIFVFLLMAGMSNAVNLNDGLDGLCGGCSAVTLAVMGMVAFRSDDLALSVFAFACVGACIGFLWFNCYPAQIFMGDTGSLALGTGLAALAVLTKSEVVSLIIGGIFIIEVLSVIIQVISFHFFGRRVFLMAPLHHHFEKKGWAETKVVTRFWIIAGAFAAIGFALYFQLL